MCECGDAARQNTKHAKASAGQPRALGTRQATVSSVDGDTHLLEVGVRHARRSLSPGEGKPRQGAPGRVGTTLPAKTVGEGSGFTAAPASKLLTASFHSFLMALICSAISVFAIDIRNHRPAGMRERRQEQFGLGKKKKEKSIEKKTCLKIQSLLKGVCVIFAAIFRFVCTLPFFLA